MIQWKEVLRFVVVVFLFLFDSVASEHLVGTGKNAIVFSDEKGFFFLGSSNSPLNLNLAEMENFSPSIANKNLLQASFLQSAYVYSLSKEEIPSFSELRLCESLNCEDLKKKLLENSGPFTILLGLGNSELEKIEESKKRVSHKLSKEEEKIFQTLTVSHEESFAKLDPALRLLLHLEKRERVIERKRSLQEAEHSFQEEWKKEDALFQKLQTTVNAQLTNRKELQSQFSEAPQALIQELDAKTSNLREQLALEELHYEIATLAFEHYLRLKQMSEEWEIENQTREVSQAKTRYKKHFEKLRQLLSLPPLAKNDEGQKLLSLAEEKIAEKKKDLMGTETAVTRRFGSVKDDLQRKMEDIGQGLNQNKQRLVALRDTQEKRKKEKARIEEEIKSLQKEQDLLREDLEKDMKEMLFVEKGRKEIYKLQSNLTIIGAAMQEKVHLFKGLREKEVFLQKKRAALEEQADTDLLFRQKENMRQKLEGLKLRTISLGEKLARLNVLLTQGEEILRKQAKFVGSLETKERGSSKKIAEIKAILARNRAKLIRAKEEKQAFEREEENLRKESANLKNASDALERRIAHKKVVSQETATILTALKKAERILGRDIRLVEKEQSKLEQDKRQYQEEIALLREEVKTPQILHPLLYIHTTLGEPIPLFPGEIAVFQGKNLLGTFKVTEGISDISRIKGRVSDLSLLKLRKKLANLTTTY